MHRPGLRQGARWKIRWAVALRGFHGKVNLFAKNIDYRAVLWLSIPMRGSAPPVRLNSLCWPRRFRRWRKAKQIGTTASL